MGERGGDIPLLAAGAGGAAPLTGQTPTTAQARWSSVRVRGSTKSLVRLEPCNGLGAQLPLNGLLSPVAPAAVIGKEVNFHCILFSVVCVCMCNCVVIRNKV